LQVIREQIGTAVNSHKVISASLTRKRSVVRIHYRPLYKVVNLQAKREV
jgi:hypothetical protein